jgi:hypothetical protein
MFVQLPPRGLYLLDGKSGKEMVFPKVKHLAVEYAHSW